MCISHFMFYTNDITCCSFYIYFREIMLDKKANSSDFLEFKMGHKAVETTHSINNGFHPGTDNKCTGQR